MIEQVRIPARDRFPLSATVYHPDEAAARNSYVVINSAMAVKRSFYDRYARFLAEEGFTTVTYDYRGIGDSRPRSLRGFKATVSDWAEKDIAGVIEWTIQRSSSATIMIVAHSIGGQMIGLVPNNNRIAAMVAIAAQSGYWGLWGFPEMLGMLLVWYLVIPTVTRVFGYLPGARAGMGEDVPAGVALQWARWGRHRGYMIDAEGRPMREHFGVFSAPILAYSFSDDRYAPRRTVEALLGYFSRASVVHRHLSPADVGVRSIGHFGFFREAVRPSLWRTTADWLKQW